MDETNGIDCRVAALPGFPLFQVEQGLKLYRAHKQQAAVRKWRGALKNIRQREDKFALLGYLYQAYMDWGKYRYSCLTRCCLFLFPTD